MNVSELAAQMGLTPKTEESEVVNTEVENVEQTLPEPEVVETTTETVETTTTEETKPEETVSQGTFNEAEWLKEKTGFDSLDALLEAVKKEPQKEEISFENELSKKIFDYLKEGKEEELENYFISKKEVKALEGKSDEELLKFFIKKNNPLFSDEEVEEEYEEKYSIDDAFTSREKKKVQQRIADDAKKAKEFFKDYSDKIQLPEIAPKNVQQDQPSQAEIDEFNKMVEAFHNSIKSVPLDDSALKVEFNDEANKLNIEVQFTPDKDGFEKAKQAALNYNEWLDRKYSKDGKHLTKDMVMDIYFSENREKYTREIINQTKNQMLTWFLKNEKGRNTATPRSFNQVPVTDIEKLAAQLGNRRA